MKSVKVTSVAAVDIPIRGANKHSKELRVFPCPGSFKRRSPAVRLYHISTAATTQRRAARARAKKGVALRIWQRLGNLLVEKAAKMGRVPAIER